MKTKLIFTGLVLIALSAFVSAQENTSTQAAGKQQARGIAYVDANNDGVCDNYGTHSRNAAVGKKGKANGTCNGQGPGRGHGKKHAQGKRAGAGPNFIDANKNGVCDNAETPSDK